MINSVRARLTLWYTGVLAFFLIGFSVVAWAFLRASGRARVDEALEETAAAVAGAMEFERTLGKPDSAAMVDVLNSFPLHQTDVIVLRRESGAIFQARSGVAPQSASAKLIAVPSSGDIQNLLTTADTATTEIQSVREDGTPLRIFTLPYQLGSERLVIATVQSLAGPMKSLHEAALGLAVIIPVLLGLATFVGYGMARKSLQPVAAMTERADIIGAASLHERLPVNNPSDELGRLARVLNELLDRVQSAFEEQRRFMADASHELRTPVAVISGEAELALSRPDRSNESLRETLQVVKGESRRLSGIIQDLFLLARSEAGERILRLEPLYLADLLAECVRAIQTVAMRSGATVCLEPVSGDLAMTGDEAVLRRLFMNLLENALKYGGHGVAVRVSARSVDSEIVVDISDTGPGIASGDQDRIFDRFFRTSGASRGDGAGLGLAIARWIARAHGGDVTLHSTSPDGSTFRVTLSAGAA